MIRTEETTVTRMAGDERRLQILRVAERLFSQKGFRGTTTKEIAQAAGVSEAMVFRHFATKSELYAAIIDQKACQGNLPEPNCVALEARERKDDYAVFYELTLLALNEHEQNPEFMRLLLHSALENHELSQMFFERFVVTIYESLGSYIAERQRDGVFRQMDPRIVVRAFVGMMIHHSLNNSLWDKERRLLNISNEEAAHSFAEILLRGVTI